MYGRCRQADGGNLYIARACANVWKGTRQLVCEFDSYFLSPPLRSALRGCVSVPFGCVSVLFRLCLRSTRFPSSLFHSVFVLAVPFGLALVSVLLGSRPFHSVSPVASVSLGLCSRCGVFELPLSPAVTSFLFGFPPSLVFSPVRNNLSSFGYIEDPCASEHSRVRDTPPEHLYA